ncbi:MAG: hypothetical protein GXO89_15000, partial [Chlorobi bacterium]|nr:hypothetical protein [Chlorobiota bacterium]
MKKLTSLIFGILISFFSTYAQEPEFTVLLEENMHDAIDMLQTSSGDYVIAGTIQAHVLVFVAKVSKYGDLLWSNYFVGDMQWFARITQKSNGHILIPMNNSIPHLLELSESGDSLGCTVIHEPKRSYFGQVIEMADSSLVATELIYNEDIWFPAIDSSYLIKMDKLGNIINKTAIQYHEIKQISPNGNNNILSLITPYSSVNTRIIGYDINGQEISNSYCTSMNPNLFSINKLSNDQYMSCGYIDGKSMHGAISKFNNYGEIEFCKEYPSFAYFMSATSDLSSGLIYLLGQKDDSCTITAMDFSGNVISEYIVDDSLIGTDIIFENDNLYLCGYYEYSYSSHRSCFIKINKNSVLSIDEGYSFPEIKTYPNPARDYVIFELPTYTIN